MHTDPPRAGAAHDGPILLFDGVCNLCNAVVNFVIDRDPKARFRFASLQSDAAKQELERAGAPAGLPDSVILIDGAGVHTQSTAALRAARRLGLPWSLLALALVIPRRLRDPLYAWIARHRYRWFGRQTACRIPTPDLRARFLDADEPPRVVEPTGDAPSASRRPRTLGLSTLPARFLLLYPIVFMLPFPITLLATLLGVIPGFSGSVVAAPLDWLIGFHTQLTQRAVAWMADAFLSVEVSFRPTGSGDGLASWLGVALDLAIAFVFVAIWWAWRRSKPISPKVSDGARVLLRYYLATVMLAYGFAKVFPLQFPAMGPDRLLQPYGDSSPMGLLWTFMGASPAYQIFAGAAEVLGGLLLFFRRTTLAGALVAAAVMTNVFVMNMAFDVPVKLYSFHYLAFAVILGLPDVPRLVGLLVANVPVAARDLRPFWSGSRTLRRAAGAAKIALIAVVLYNNISSGLTGMRTRGLWAAPHPLRGVYRVESFTMQPADGEDAAPADLRWVRVGLNPPFVGTVQRVGGDATRMLLRVDDQASTLALFDRGATVPPDGPLAYELLDDGALRLTGVFDGRGIDALLRRQEVESLLTTRGFRWINEFPFNR